MERAFFKVEAVWLLSAAFPWGSAELEMNHPSRNRENHFLISYQRQYKTNSVVEMVIKKKKKKSVVMLKIIYLKQWSAWGSWLDVHVKD